MLYNPTTFMRFEEFSALVHRVGEGGGDVAFSSAALRALALDARGDWKRAHEEAQDDESADGAWVHAYLHRKEGDLSNAAYWYGRAGRSPPSVTLEEEWALIARDVLSRSAGH